jgi:hypothetical protein
MYNCSPGARNDAVLRGAVVQHRQFIAKVLSMGVAVGDESVY